MLMSLGDFVFEVPTLAYDELQRNTAWRHPSAARVGSAPAHQFLGQGDDTITLTGVVYTEIGNPQSLDTLRSMADAGLAYALVDGDGYVYGQWSINSLSENKSFFDPKGSAKRTGFSISLTHINSGQQSAGKQGKGNEGKGK